MRQRLVLVVVPALLTAATDLALKLTLPTEAWLFHHRSAAWIDLSTVLLLATPVLARLPSRLVALAAGVFAGGVLGNLVSASWNDGSVPNPFVVVGRDGVLAFNLADVFVLVGIVLLTASLVLVTIRNRDVLPQSTLPVRAVRGLRARRSS